MLKLLLLLLPIGAIAIRGGEEIEIVDYPWMGSYQTTGNTHVCGLTLIGRVWAITAAQCGAGPAFTTKWGVKTTNSPDGLREIANVTVHPSYGIGSGERYPNDISLVELVRGAPAIAIAVAIRDATISPEEGFVSGWGRTEPNGLRAVNLKGVILPTIPDNNCQLKWFTGVNPDIQFCTYDESETKGICTYDEGGPFVVDNGILPSNETDYILEGVASFFYDTPPANCDNSWPNVFTRVSPYYTWICNLAADNLDYDPPDGCPESKRYAYWYSK